MSVFIWADTARNSLCGFCVREAFERKYERGEKEKRVPTPQLLKTCLPIQNLEATTHQDNRISRTQTTTRTKE